MPRKAPHFMRWVIADYRRDTASLETIHHGAYVLLLMELWERGGELPADPVELAAITGCGRRQFASVWHRIARFFVASDGRSVLDHRPPGIPSPAEGIPLRDWLRSCGTISQRRISADLAQVAEIAEKRAAAGRRGGRASRPPGRRPDPPESEASACIETTETKPLTSSSGNGDPSRAGARAHEENPGAFAGSSAPSDVDEGVMSGTAMDSPGAWRQLLVSHFGWPLHGVQSPKAAQLFQDGCRSGITAEEAVRAINGAHAALRGERPGTVAYYRPFLREVLQQRRDRGGLEDETSSRSGKSPGRRVPLAERNRDRVDSINPDECWGDFFGQDDQARH